MNPMITVLMPTYNREHLLRRAVESVFAQSYKDIELIVVNDASTDGTKAYLDDLAARDPRVRPIHNATNNYPDISKTLNSGLAVARGAYVARLDDDDYWIDNDKLKKQLAFFEAHPEHMVVGAGMVVVDEQGKELYRFFKRETDEEIRRTALTANPFGHTTVMFRAEPARAVGGYGDWRYIEDWDLWLKLGTKGKLHNLQEYLTAYTFTGQNKSFTYLRPQSRMILEFIGTHRKEYPGYARGYMVNTAQYVYSFLPVWLRRPFQNVLASFKRKAF